MFSLRQLLAALVLGLLLTGVTGGQTIVPGGQRIVRPNMGGGVMPNAQGQAKPNPAQALGYLYYRNDTGVGVIVQVTGIDQNKRPVVYPAQPIGISGAASSQIRGHGEKTITIYDAMGRPLGQQRINFTGTNLAFLIQLETIMKGTEKISRAKLVPFTGANAAPPAKKDK